MAGMGQEDKSTNWVKSQPVPARIKWERSSDPADSGKKVLPGVERFRFFRGLAKRRESTFFPMSKTFSTKRFPHNTVHVIWGVTS
jgi:hypothetical protein